MITVEQANAIIESQVQNFGTEKIPLNDALGRVLKENWYADRDFPPFNRVTMDGIAIAFEAFENGKRSFPVEGIAAAGAEQQTLQNSENCLEVMTGCVLPHGCDTVIRYEDLTIENKVAQLNVPAIRAKQNVHRQAEDRNAGDMIVPTNVVISPAEIGIGASLGKAQVEVAKLPRVLVISTGDELIEIDQTPLPHQIRRSNVFQIQTALKDLGLPVHTAHLNDDYATLLAQLELMIADCDVLLLSGGVSKGKFDYLPQVFDELGVEKLFHRVAQRPGKPFWFGQHPKGCTIFAFPGNPVSSFVCLHAYFMPWLAQSLALKKPVWPMAKLEQDVEFKPPLTYYLEVQLRYDETGTLLAKAIKGNGSGDFANLVQTDAFIKLPKHKNLFEAGEVYPVIPYRRKL